jgi:tRNA uridine 5-carbamoylmethylation protein Kti12
MKPIVVNLFASPGSGKSTTASGLFYELKNRGINAELTGEYAKDLTWSHRHNCLQDQIYVFGKQHHRVWRLQNDVDVVISDSPILLGLAYAESYPECFKQTVYWAFNQYNNINFLINRVKPYNPKGRNQTPEESAQKHEVIKDLLYSFDVPYLEIDGNEYGLDTIVSHVLNKINSN